MKNRKEVLRFKAEIMDDLENISRIVGIIKKRKKEMKKHTFDADVYLDSIIHNIESFYMGIEEIFKKIGCLSARESLKARAGIVRFLREWQEA